MRIHAILPHVFIVAHLSACPHPGTSQPQKLASYNIPRNPFGINISASVHSNQLKVSWNQRLQKTGGGALLLLTRFPTRKSVLTSVARKDPSPSATTGGSHLVGRELSSRPTIPFAAGLAPPCQAFPHSTFNFRLSTVSHKLQHKGGPASPIRHDDPLQYCDFNFQLSTFNRHNSTPPDRRSNHRIC